MMWRNVGAAVLFVVPGVVHAQAASRCGYVVRRGEQDLVRETYTFDGRVLQSTMLVPARGIEITGRTEYDASLVPTRYRSSVRRAGDTTALQSIDVTFGPDSLHWEITGQGARTGALPIAAPYTLFRNLAFSHLAVAVLRAYRTSGGTATYATWVPDGNVVIPMTIDVAGDTGTLVMQGVQMHLTTSDRWIRSVEIPAQGVTVEWRDQVDLGIVPADTAGPKPPASVQESPYAFRSSDLELDGTLTVPARGAGPWPVGLIVAGSGPTDRNGNSAAGIETNMYAELAWGLADHGIATVRYDKRGLGRSRGSFDLSKVTFDDFAGDVAAGVRALVADGRFGQVYVIGHSEGAALGIRAVQMGAPVGGLVLVSGMGRDFTTVLRQQLGEQLDSATLAAFDQAWPRYLHGEEVGDVPAVLRSFFAPVNRRFVQTSQAFRPADALASVSVPTLIVQGATDVQVSVEDARLLAAAKPDAKLVILPEVNHVLKRAPKRDRVAQGPTYLDPSLPIAPEVVTTIADWIRAKR